MRCVSVALLVFAAQVLAAPASRKKPVTLFTCPSEGLCYASPRNCVDDCNAAFSMWSPDNHTTVYNMTMMSPLSFTAVLIKEQGSDKYDKAVICSFHALKGIMARVNFPDPIVVHQFVDSTEPEGHTDTLYTQCSVNVSTPAPTKAKFKMICGKWRSEIVLDENLAIDVVPAVENAKVMSTSQKVDIESLRTAVVRASEDDEEEDDDKVSESVVQRRQFIKKKNIEKTINEELEEGDETEEKTEMETKKNKKVVAEEDEDDTEENGESAEATVKKVKSDKVLEKDSKKLGKTANDDEEEEEVEEETLDKTKKKKKYDEEIPRFKEYEDEEDEEREERNLLPFPDPDPDHASGACVLTGLLLSLLSIYHL